MGHLKMKYNELNLYLGGKVKWFSHFEKQFGSFSFKKYIYYMTQGLYSSVFILVKWNVCSHRNRNVNIYTDFTLTHQNLEKSNYPIKWCIDKQIVVHGIRNLRVYSAIKRDEAQIWHNTDKCQIIVINEKSQHKMLHAVWFHLYDILEMGKKWGWKPKQSLGRRVEYKEVWRCSRTILYLNFVGFHFSKPSELCAK